MVLKHNNQLPNAHFRKDWQLRVKTWFDQPGRKLRRRQNRAKKAATVAPRPVDGLLRPIVACPTNRYNMKVRAGRGFSFDELKAAGINRKEARSIGIAVDHRRRNRSEESLQRNVERLQLYKSKLIVFPRRAGKAKKGDSEAAELAQASQVSGELFPVKNTVTFEEPRAITSEEQTFSAFQTLLNLRSDLRQAGNRAKIAKAKAEEEAQKVKK